MRKALLVLVLVHAACNPPGEVERGSLPVLHTADPVKAERGRALFMEDTITRPFIPRAGLENLWITWDGGYDGDYWAAFRKRYGMHEAPFENQGLPLGMRQVGDNVSFDCMLCHGGTIGGQVTLGVANSLLDVQSLLDDLSKAASLAGIDAPVTLTERTGAAGAIDAVGMGPAFGKRFYGAEYSDLNEHCGFQRAPAWWQLKHKKKTFTDGSGDAPSFRTMAATLLADGLSVEEIAAREPEFEDIGHWILSLEAPAWPYGAIDRERFERGQKVYTRDCASCHGVYHGEGKSFPDEIVPVRMIGTDAMRAERLGQREVDAINTTWFGQPPMVHTDGYLAPTLIGIWARAPYFHNGSVPDLAGVIDTTARPPIWRRTGSARADYDEAKLGWRYDTPSSGGDRSTVAGRAIYDTSIPGLGNAGHRYGDTLTDEERASLLEYLKSL